MRARFEILGCMLVVAAVALGGCGEFDFGDGEDDDAGNNETTTINNDNNDSTTNNNDATNNGSQAGVEGWEWVAAPATEAHINSIEFFDDDRGWMATDGDPLVADRGAWYTDNGGDNWEFRREDFDAYAVGYDALGERVWMGGSDSRELWVSEDGHDFQPTDDGLNQQDWIGHLYFWDRDTGILGSQTGERIHRTEDGGETFEEIAFEDDYVNGMNSITVDGDRAWVTTGADFTQDNTGGVILYSEDRGENWEMIEFEDDAHHYEGGSIRDVHVVSDDEIWAGGRNRQLYYTDDGMESWNQIEGVPNEISGFDGIDGNGDHIVAGGNHEDGIFIWESTDGGDSWEMTFEDTSCGSGCEINGIEYVNDELAFAYGYGNTLIKFHGW